MIGARKSQLGLSLVEIMISLAIGAFMLLGIIALVASVSGTRSKLAVVSAQAENGRYALHLLSEDLALAGFLGRYRPGVGVATYVAPDPCENSGVASDLGFDPSTTTLPLPITAVVSGGAMPGCISAESPVANSELLSIHRVAVEDIAVDDIPSVNNTPYLQISNCELDLQNYRLSTDASALTLRAKGCVDTARVRAYMVRSYFVSSCEDCSASGDGRPTLKVLEYAGGSRSVLPLVSGVEDIHFAYGLDLDGDGGPDCYAANPGSTVAPSGCPTANWSSTAVENWRDVVSVRVDMLIRSEEEVLGSAVKDTYDLGRASALGPFDDRFKRQVVSSVVMLPNIAGPRE
ncbi:PilW family protein [Spongiibacter sp.]|uniref:PilW family protein n=1 Tax=Spongiibacter sp. TaxID=2024860 RepID=UPI00356B0C7F